MAERYCLRLPEETCQRIFKEMGWFRDRKHVTYADVICNNRPVILRSGTLSRSYSMHWFPASHLPWNRNRRPKANG